MNDMFKRWPACDGGCARMIFDRDISSWCVQQITSTPSGFNDNANTPIRAEYLPRWGESCGATVTLTDSDGDNKLTYTETAIITATFNKDMNSSPQYSLNGGAYTNLTSTGDPKIWTLLLDATPLTPSDYTVTVTGTCVSGGYTYDPSTGIITIDTSMIYQTLQNTGGAIALSGSDTFDNRGIIVLRTSNTGVRALSRNCTHAGFTVNINTAANNLVCPSHNSIFDLNGCLLYTSDAADE